MGSTNPLPARYLNRLVTSSAGVRLLEARVFPDAKEVTESFAVRQAVTRVPGLDPGDSDVVLVAVGDGTTPRTAATFALTTAWECHSVDPRLRTKLAWSRIPRLSCHAVGAEALLVRGRTVVVAMVHAHVDVPTALGGITAEQLIVIAMPCCVPVGIDAPPAVRYRDDAVGSPENEILIWLNPPLTPQP